MFNATEHRWQMVYEIIKSIVIILNLRTCIDSILNYVIPWTTLQTFHVHFSQKLAISNKHLYKVHAAMILPLTEIPKQTVH